MQKIFVYSISILIFLAGNVSRAQDKKLLKDTTNEAWFDGISIQTDLASFANTLISNGATFSTEGSVQLNLKHKLFPTLEIGYAGDHKTALSQTEFNTSGLYGRIGIDLNLLKPKKDSQPTNNLLFGGVRLGFSHFAYNITNIVQTDNYWGGIQVSNYLNVPVTKVWFEVVAGVQVEIIKNIYMGWTIRNKSLLGQDIVGKPTPYYIPGFGTNTGSTWGFSYLIGYHF